MSDMERNAELDQAELRVLDLKARALEIDIAAGERMSAETIASSKHTGRFHFIGPVHESSVHGKIMEIQSFVDRYPDAEVEILLNSGGGSVWDGFAFIDYLNRLQRRGTHIRIVGIGVVASMAGIILQCASERVLTDRAWFHAHEVSNMIAGTVTVQEDNIKLSKALQSRAIELLCARSTLTPTKLKSMWARKDVYMDAKEALRLGLIDRIEGSE
jgi:ATP-dependent protease ClpP protease subunit